MKRRPSNVYSENYPCAAIAYPVPIRLACAGLLSCSGFVFKLASGLLSLLAIAVMITYSVKNGIILLVLAFLISPMGLPLLAVQGLGKLQDVNAAMKNFIHS